MVADVSHTPEVDGPQGQQVFIAWHENAGEIYPDRRLNDAEIAHILTTHFNDVRLKNYIELRHWDSLPMKRASRLLEVVGGIFYDPDRFARLVGLLDGVSEEDVLQAKADLQVRGGQASPYGRSLDFWRQALGAEDTLDGLPGDPRHPDLFQS